MNKQLSLMSAFLCIIFVYLIYHWHTIVKKMLSEVGGSEKIHKAVLKITAGQWSLTDVTGFVTAEKLHLMATMTTNT